jgi:hypothetical protein
MSQISSHTELMNGLSYNGEGLPLISTLGPDSWLYALSGHTPEFPRTLTVIRTRAKVSSSKYGWKFVFSILEEDDTGAALPQPHIVSLDFRPTKGGASGEALHAMLHLVSAFATNVLVSGLSEYAASYTPGSFSDDILELGYTVPPGNLMPVTTV